MKKITLIASLLCLFACEGIEPTKEIKGSNRFMSNGSYWSIIVIDGCEYINYEGIKPVSLTHKGNCKNHAK